MEELDRGLARALSLEARATGNLGKIEQAVALANRAYAAYPAPEAAREVGRWLAEELGAVEALNMDGGPEAALAVKAEPGDISTPGVGLPTVLVVLPP